MTKKEEKEAAVKTIKSKRTYGWVAFFMTIIFISLAIAFFTSPVQKVMSNIFSSTTKIIKDASDVVSPKWSFNPSLDGIKVYSHNGQKIIARENLDSKMLEIAKSIIDWKSKSVIFGGNLVTDYSGEIVWINDGKSTSIGAVLDVVNLTDGVAVINNPSNIEIAGLETSVGALAIYKHKRLGFLWETDTLIVQTQNLKGNYTDPKDFEWYWFLVKGDPQIKRNESPYTKLIN